MKIEDIYNFIESLDEKEFFHYLSPESYYNSPLKYSICSNEFPKIETRKLLDIYFLLKENEDEILDLVANQVLNFTDEDYEIDQISVNWYILIFKLMNWDWKKTYQNLKIGKSSEYTEKLIELNENFDRKSYFIINDRDSEESLYTKDLCDAVYLLKDRDQRVNLEKVIKGESFESWNFTLKKGDYILYNKLKEIKISESDKKETFYQEIKKEFTKENRDLRLSALLGERRVVRFNNHYLNHKKYSKDMKKIISIREFWGSRNIGYLPNPKKTINVNINIEDVKKAVKKVSNKYYLLEEDEILNQYKFNASQFLNLGSYAFVNLDELSKTRTSITIEISRKVGSFDSSVEIANANRHIDSLFSEISNVIRRKDEVKSNTSSLTNFELSELESKNRTLERAKEEGYTEVFNSEDEVISAGRQGKITQSMKVVDDGKIVWVGKK
jgi:hypothetical protein